METKKRWQAGFIGSLIFHTAIFLSTAFLLAAGASVLPVENKENIVEIDYIAGGEGGGGGGGGSGTTLPQDVTSGGNEKMETVEISAASQPSEQIIDRHSKNEKVEETRLSGVSRREQPDTGSGGGFGTGVGTGTGSGTGPGSGSGSGGGSGSGHGTGVGAGSGSGAGRVTTPPRLINSPQPAYPEEARTQGWMGMVRVKALVNDRGAVKDVTVVASSGHDSLDAAAVATVLNRWRFQAAKNPQGMPVSCYVNLDVTFNLR